MVAAFVLPDSCCSTSESGTHEHSHDHADHNHSHTHADPSDKHKNVAVQPKVRLVSTNTVAKEECCEHCTVCHPKNSADSASADDSHAHWSKPLFTQEDLANYIGDQAAVKVASLQPFLSPIGGLFLVVAHLMNIRLSCCGSASCSSRASKSGVPSENLT